MESSILNWLEAVGSTAFRWSAIAFVLVNGLAVAAVVLTRDRSLVNRWTGRILAVNVALAGTGIGIPLLTAASRVAVAAILPGSGGVVPTIDRDETPRADLQALERSSRK
jgi:hypothetical protein